MVKVERYPGLRLSLGRAHRLWDVASTGILVLISRGARMRSR